MRGNDGIFLSGVVLITILSATILLVVPDDVADELIPIVKLAMGIWILRSLLNFFGHSL
ncbi:hypothetical protein [Sporosarcina sp. HYO08]|uniref:hypothetical protein n=1 Tax=Sporosarcina sp. HYO08 TaxID=1759557 RepID=UPI0012E3E2AE|nr:hypothetical protein [Sporosarcina sp. HYO08]